MGLQANDDAGAVDYASQHGRRFERPAGAETQGVVVFDSGSGNADLEEVDLHTSEHSRTERPGYSDTRPSASLWSIKRIGPRTAALIPGEDSDRQAGLRVSV